jgi:hypothetical protein
MALWFAENLLHRMFGGWSQGTAMGVSLVAVAGLAVAAALRVRAARKGDK